MAAKDITQKALEDYNDVFADIVNTIVFEGEPIVSEQELENVKDKSAYEHDGQIYEQERDVIKRWVRKEQTVATFGLENQSTREKYMVRRIISYDGAEYKKQSNTSEGYPVCTIVLNFNTKQWDKDRTLYPGLKFPREELKKYCSDYRYEVVDVRFLEEETISRFRSDFGAIVDYLANGTKEGYKVSEKKLKHPTEVKRFLAAMTGDVEYEDEKMEGAESMCEIADRFRNDGRREGIQIGKNEGIRQGKNEERSNMLRMMIKVNVEKEKIFAMGYSEDEYRNAEKPEAV